MSEFGSHMKIDRYHRSHIKLCRTGVPLSVYSPGTVENQQGTTVRTYLINDNITPDHPLSVDNTSFTMEMWMKIDELGDGRTQFFGTGNGGWRWRMIDDYSEYETIIFNGANVPTHSISLDFERWYHHAWTYNNDTNEAKIYLDGGLVVSGNIGDVTHGQEGHAYNVIDHSHNDDQNHGDNLIGNACEMRVWNVVRSQAQIQEWMHKQVPNPSQVNSLIGYWQPTSRDLADWQEFQENPSGGSPDLEDLSGTGFPLNNVRCEIVTDEHPFL